MECTLSVTGFNCVWMVRANHTDSHPFIRPPIPWPSSADNTCNECPRVQSAIYPSTLSSIHQHPLVHLMTTYPSLHPFIRFSSHSLVPIHSAKQCPFIHPSHSFTHPPINHIYEISILIHPFICQHSLNHTSINLSIHPFYARSLAQSLAQSLHSYIHPQVFARFIFCKGSLFNYCRLVFFWFTKL